MRTYKTILCALAASVALTGCSQFVKRDEMNQELGQLRSEMSEGDAALAQRIDLIGAHLSELSRELQVMTTQYDAKLAQLEARLTVNVPVHFAFDDATVSEQDKDALARFSQVVRDHSDNLVITVEGFTDPAGSEEYNLQLGKRRAEAVKQYLIENGLQADRVKAVSYGESKDRLIAPGSWGKGGSANRRVALVIDYVGPAAGE